MPEFILDTGGGVALADAPAANANHYWGSLDDFTQGYIEALFFTENAPGIDREEFETADYQDRMREGRTDGSIPGDTGFSDLAPDALAKIIRDCAKFQRVAAELLQSAYERPGYDATCAGRDYWFTRNGHGVGFWDRSELDYDGLGDSLSELCRHNEIDVYWDSAAAAVRLG